MSAVSGSIMLVNRKVAPESLKNLSKERNWAFVKDGAKEADTELFYSSLSSK